MKVSELEKADAKLRMEQVAQQQRDGYQIISNESYDLSSVIQKMRNEGDYDGKKGLI